MPYFVYQISADNKLTNLGSYPGYREARTEVRELRGKSGESSINYRIIFAQNEMQAEVLLLTPREKPVEGDD